MSTITSESRPTVPPGEPRPIIPPLAAFYAHSRDLSYLVIRLTAGGMLLVHGINKVMPMAEKGLTATIEAFAAGSLARRGIEPSVPLAYADVRPRDDRRDLHHARLVHAVLRRRDRHPVPGHHVRRALAAGLRLEPRRMGIPAVLGPDHVSPSVCAAAVPTRSTASSAGSCQTASTRVVVEGGAAARRDRVGAGERVDAAAVAIGGIRPDRLGDQHPAAQAVEMPRVQAHLARAYCRAPTSVAVGDAVHGRVVRMDHHLGRPSFARELGISVNVELRKPRAGEVASRNGCSASASSIDLPMIGQRRHGRDRSGRAAGCGTAPSASRA